MAAEKEWRQRRREALRFAASAASTAPEKQAGFARDKGYMTCSSSAYGRREWAEGARPSSRCAPAARLRAPP
eukprot:gene10473-3626_t